MFLLNVLSTASEAVAEVAEGVSKVAGVSIDHAPDYMNEFIRFLVKGGEKILIATLIFIIGKFLISLIKRLARRFMRNRKVDPGVKSFLMSLLNILLVTLLIITVISALGINTTSFAALLASAGVAIGMALSGNLQNFAGGVVILLFRPYKVGDYIDAQGVSGTVREIQIFHTVISTPDNKEIFIPNGSLSSGVITNVNSLERRRAEWLVAVEYGVPYDEVVRAFTEIVDADERILKDSAPSIVLKELGDNGVIYRVRAWVNTPDYWDVFFDINKKIYADFNEKGIGFPFPQLTIHKGDA